MAGREIADVRDHHGQERVGRDVEGNTQEDVGAALVQVARKPAAQRRGLEENVHGAPHLRRSPTFHELTMWRLELGRRESRSGPRESDRSGGRRQRARIALGAVDSAEAARVIGHSSQILTPLSLR